MDQGLKLFTIRLTDIPTQGLDIEEALDREWTEGLLGLQYFPGDDPLLLRVRLSIEGNTVVARGSISGSLHFVCSRCAESADFELDSSFMHVFLEGAVEEGEEGGELNYTMFSGDEFSLEPVIAEELAVALVAVPLCRDDCKGLCQHCGKNLNEGPCGCGKEVDPRWEKLRSLKIDQ